MIARRLTGLFVVAALAVAGCGSSTDADRPASPPSGALLEFTATTVDGKPFDGRTLAGKPAVLWFWAPWCPVCLQQAPGVRKAVEQYGAQVSIIGVASLDKAASMPEFVTLAKVESMPHLADERGEVWKRFGITAQSIFVLIDAKGTVTLRSRLSSEEIPDRVQTLLG